MSENKPGQSAQERFTDLLGHLKRTKEHLDFIVEVYKTDPVILQPNSALVAFDAVAKDALLELEEATRLAKWGLQEAGQEAAAKEGGTHE